MKNTILLFALIFTPFLLLSRINSSMDFEIPYLKDSRIRLAYTPGVGMNYNLSLKNQLFIQSCKRIYPGVYIKEPITSDVVVTRIINVGVEIGYRRVLPFVKTKNS